MSQPDRVARGQRPLPCTTQDSYHGTMLVDPNHPFFRRKWVRIACVVAPAGWAVLELATGNPFWAIVFGAAAAALFHALILNGPDR
ncbi:hypothetical protein [Paracoccus sp. SCSIO 75233]|uniref:hypothetical protein n=1 Tax=Paracoccus sp. SCSIO 75233 TaxID=3017782 RepID=UPI0022F05C1F|nr:hypothetical protein [Paracoccus sp. SCSIO 75233]WBU52485.1 hypothetical protein PAF12_11735 [Paracoccus sp. SCSIO 75233]